MTKAIIPSERRKVLPQPKKQRRHVRRYESGKKVVVNPKNKPSLPIKSRSARKKTALLKAQVRPKQQVKLRPKIRTPWTDILSKDIRPKPDYYQGTEGLLMSSEERKKQYAIKHMFDVKEAAAEVYDEEYCDQNCTAFENEYLEVPLNILQDQFEAGLSLEEVRERREDIINEAISTLRYDLDEPTATITYSDGDIHLIGTYRNMAISEGINVEWEPIGGWRGYYQVKIDPDSDWQQVHEDVALAMSEDEKELNKFDKELRKKLDELNIPWARAVSRSSNIFASEVDYMIKKKDYNKVKVIVEVLKNQYRDIENYVRAAENPFYKELDKAAKRLGKKELSKLISGITKDKNLKKDIDLFLKSKKTEVKG